MALGAGYRRVLIGQRKAGRTVIEFSIGPRRNRMAGCTSGGRVRESRCNVIRDVAAKCGRPIPIAYVAAIAIHRVQRVVTVDVAGGARRRDGRHMGADQDESRGGMVEFPVGPFGDRVAGGASCRGIGESCGHVVGDIAAKRCCLVPVFHVAAVAVC